jgi:hypothetical protein
MQAPQVERCTACFLMDLSTSKADQRKDISKENCERRREEGCFVDEKDSKLLLGANLGRFNDAAPVYTGDRQGRQKRNTSRRTLNKSKTKDSIQNRELKQKHAPI